MGRTKKKKRPKRRGLSAATRAAMERAERFAQEYVVDLNGTQAAIRAGYAPKGAHVQASRLLNVPKVAARVAELKTALAKRYEVTQERTLKQIARIAYGDPRILYRPDGSLKKPSELDEDGAALLAGLETEQEYVGEASVDANGVTIAPKLILTSKVKVRSSERALSMAMNYLGMNKSGGVAGESGLVLSIRCSDGKAVR
jgi:phage terminase small subunit